MESNTRHTIREVAIELFATRGFGQTSLREIAERVGLTKASLYYHYPSKQALLASIMEPMITGWRVLAEDTEDLPHGTGNVRLVMERCLDVLLRNRSVAGIFMRDPAGVVAAAGPMWETVIDLSMRLNTWLAGPSASTEERLRAAAAMEVLGTVLTSSNYMIDATDEELRSVLLDAAFQVLRLPEPSVPDPRKLG